MVLQNVRQLPGFTILEVRDPAEMDERSRVSGRLPGRNSAHCYRLRDRARARQERGNLLTRLAMRRLGDLQISHAADRFGTAIGIIDPGMSAYCFGLVSAGRMSISAGADWVEAGPTKGLIYSGQAGTQLLTADGTERTNLWLSTARFEAALVALLKERPAARLTFAPTIDWTVGSGARLRRLFAHAEAEFAQPDSFGTDPLARTAFIDLFVHTALQILPHNFTEMLSRPDHPSPVHLRRAEAYLDAHSDAPLRVEDLALQAGCSARALQRAFRQFRDTTPHTAIQAARLDHARAELSRGTAPVATVARRFGFSKTQRFAHAYAKRFGALPRSEA